MQYLSVGNAALSAEARQKRFVGSMAGWHGHGGMAGMGRQLGLQINQIGQVVGMATSAEQALKSASYQAADIGLIFGGMGMAIGTLAGVALPMLIDQLFKTNGSGEALGEVLDALDKSVSAYQSSARLAGASTSDLREEFGSLAASVRDSIEALREHALVTVQMDLEGAARGASKQFRDLFSDLERLESTTLSGRNLRAVEERAGYALDALRLNREEAGRLREVLFGLSTVEGGPEDMRRAFSDAISTIEALYPSVEKMPAPIRALHRALLDSDVAAARILATSEGVTNEADNAANSAETLSIELGTGADEAARLLANLNGVPSALNAMKGSVRDQIAAMQAESRSLELQLENGLSSQAANRKVQLEQMLDAASTDDRANPGLADMAAAAGQEIAELEAAAKRQEDLRDRLTEARRPARETRSRRPGAGGGSSGRGGGSSALSDELKARERLEDRIQSTADSLAAEKLALDAVASGLFETETAARLYGEALVTNGGLIDAQTEALLRQIDAAAALNEEMQRVARDPVRVWQESVPTWAEGAATIEADAIGGLKAAISDFVRTGEMDISNLFANLTARSSEVLVDQVLGGIYAANGAEGSIFGRLGGGVPGGPDTPEAAAISSAGAQIAGQLRAALTSGGQTAAAAIRAAHAGGAAAAGSQLRAAAGQIAGSVQTAGHGHATGVQQAITTAGTQHAAAVRGAVAAPGAAVSGSGFGSTAFSAVLGTVTAGLFREGGNSASPVAYASMPFSAFSTAPRYAEGTANTSGGRPAILHDNEAVIPLSRGRKVPVELGGDRRSGLVFSPTVAVTVQGSGGDKDSDEETGKRVGASVRAQLEAMMDARIAEAQRYGGMANPRGRY